MPRDSDCQWVVNLVLSIYLECKDYLCSCLMNNPSMPEETKSSSGEMDVGMNPPAVQVQAMDGMGINAGFCREKVSPAPS